MNLLYADRVMEKLWIGDIAATGYATLNGGTTGGMGGQIVEVDTFDSYVAAVGDDNPRIVVITGPITASAQDSVGSNKGIIGKNKDAKLTGVGMHILRKSNSLLPRATIFEFRSRESTNVWVDHCEIFNDQEHNKDFYDGLVDVTRASDWVTISHNYLRDRNKGSLVGHSDNNGAQDTAHLHVTYHNNHPKNVYSRGPSLRFGTGHFYNSYFNHMFECVKSRKGAQVLVEGNYFVDASKPIFGADGYAVARGNGYADSTNHNTAPLGNLTAVPYQYSLLGSVNVVGAVVGEAGATLAF
ncbi:hypothetical protein TWF225_007102 [Orbilia oligospora]|nr:hypothetical protein TWF225_007102 [Orbilia oligospora]KAF3270065.1 hypothetical protein TWF217_008407 [Orbilia oligospora]KAF3270537.1 hypothetical protein TWF128_004296 [Orbilia oligospora]KAF3276479.1 hypothetical protein TWF132_002187 [Orbilia oligospora]